MENPTHMYLYGAGGHAKVVADILASRGVRVAGVFDDNPPDAKLRIMEVRAGVQLLGGAFPKLDAPLIITVGHNVRRAELAALIDASFGTAIHPSAIIASGVPIGVGSMILHGSILQAGTRVGRHVLINTAASIDHDNLLGDFVHVSPHAALLQNLIRRGLGAPNASQRGLAINAEYEASPGCYVMGPLVAGNIIGTVKVWHAESCTRIIQLSQNLAAILAHALRPPAAAGSAESAAARPVHSIPRPAPAGPANKPAVPGLPRCAS